MNEATLQPIVLSFQVAAAALILVAPIGIPFAFLQARWRYPLHWIVDALILLPLILPPTVIGYFLVVVLGRKGILGQWLSATFDVHLVFTPTAAVIASALVSLPMLVKTLQPAIEAVPADLENVARSLGLGPLAVFFRVTLPAAWRGLLAALVLAFARAAGEFGATLMFAGNIPGRTNTMPLEIFSAYQAGDDARALVYVAVLVFSSVAVAIVASRLSPRLAAS